MSGLNPARNALPSASFGYWQATFLLLDGIRFHIGTKQPWNSLSPKKNKVQYWNVLVGWAGLPPRPAYQDSQGSLVARQGTPSVWATTATGLTVSGVDEVSSMSTLLLSTSWRATWDARLGSDWLSTSRILTANFLPPAVNPFWYAAVARIVLRTNLSPEANPASEPVYGVT